MSRTSSRLRRVGIAAAALTVAAGAASASMHPSSPAAPAAPVSPQAIAFANTLAQPPFNTLENFLAQARKQAQSRQPAAPALAPMPGWVDFSPLHALLAGLKKTK